jgi:hypothetical protein
MNIAEIISQLYPLLVEKYHQVADIELSDFYGEPAIFIDGPGLSISFTVNDDYIGEPPEAVRFRGEIRIQMRGDVKDIPWEENLERRIYRQRWGKGCLQVWTQFYPSNVEGALDLLVDAERMLQEWVLKLLCKEMR